MKWSLVLVLGFAVFSSAFNCAGAVTAEETADSGWWPKQAVPKALVRTVERGVFPAPRLAYEMMVQSVAGLAAKAVNQARGDELVWVGTHNVDVEDWLARWLKQNPGVEIRATLDPWPLVERYAQRGIIKGYILYRADASTGDLDGHRRNLDNSVNVATSLAGILDGILVDEQLEPQAQQHGLTRLADARDKSQAWCFATYRERFCRAMACTQDPQKANVRDFAIAHGAFTGFGDDATITEVMRWLAPLSPILGWNGGDERKITELSSRWAHLQTSTDWCNNLPVLMAGAERTLPARVPEFDPARIDWADTRGAVTFINTDGDNVQWLEGNFFRSTEGRSYWGSPERGKIPFGWSGCFAHLAQLCPGATDYMVGTRTPNDSFIEWGGGYSYPDQFARDRPDRWELLARHARRTWALMRRNNTRIIGFNVTRLDSPDALKAYQTFAAQTEGLLGILVFEYDRYEAGAGRTFWVKDRRGVAVPVISARYAIWNHANDRARAGTPAKIAREIRETAEKAKTSASGPSRYDWVIVHVWSWFKVAPGADENAENLPQENAAASGGVRCYLPATWCAQRLPAGVRVVGPEEMIWRIRMQHDAEQTKTLMAEWPR